MALRPRLSPGVPFRERSDGWLGYLTRRYGARQTEERVMTWKPSDDRDRDIRRWMKTKGWEVNRRPEYDSERGVYAWCHEIRGSPSPTLRISRKVLEDYPAFAVLYHLDLLTQLRPSGPVPRPTLSSSRRVPAWFSRSQLRSSV